ncbi:AraC family transcriptional regulator [Paenibacillus campinasensis]|uniref:HTH araC/xylS-type domain-containing protein n=1 Tax=Paenibacillus campinasensis TaxID=66347 RepID=A0A268EV79_9BACL|nr:AraC family transcriptional regulator [Paenibacillus campinasensis]PAD77028.1 hypothetical protein CHH67_10955 [Paenibacillus campinasensis]
MDAKLPVDLYEAADYRDIISGHISADSSYGVIRPQGRGDLLLAYTLQGRGYFKTPAGTRVAEAHELILLREDVPHQYGTMDGEQGWSFLWVHFPKLPEISYLPQEELLSASIPEGYGRERVLAAFHHIFYHAGERSDYWHALSENSIRELLLLLARQLSSKRDPRITLVLGMLSQSKQEIRVDHLAKAAGLSVSRLAHLFKEQVGEGIVEHANRLRIQQAARFMEHMDRTATEAAQDVGFNSYNHFAALFRKQMGVSPRTYKQMKSAQQQG